MKKVAKRVSVKQKKVVKKVVEKPKLMLLPSEWARQNNKDEMSYKYYDTVLGKVQETEFNKIKV